MFDYPVMSKEEAEKARFSLLDKNTYQATIKHQEARQSKSGNPMIELLLDVYDKQGIPHQIKDYAVFTEKMMWKVIHLMESCGLLDEYERKTFRPEMLENKTLWVYVGIEEGQLIPTDKLGDRPTGSKYNDKNKIEDYLSHEVKPSKLNPIKQDNDLNDDIPF